MSNVAQLASHLKDILETYEEITIDLKDVTYIDSTGLSALMGAAKLAISLKIPINKRRLVNVPKYVVHLLAITGVGKLFGGWVEPPSTKRQKGLNGDRR